MALNITPARSLVSGKHTPAALFMDAVKATVRDLEPGVYFARDLRARYVSITEEDAHSLAPQRRLGEALRALGAEPRKISEGKRAWLIGEEVLEAARQ